MKAGSTATAEGVGAEKVTPSTRIREGETLEKSEGKVRADNVCPAGITTGDKVVGVHVIKVVDTPDVAVGTFVAATPDTGNILRTDVAAEVPDTMVVLGAGVDRGNVGLSPTRISSTTSVATGETAVIIGPPPAELQGRQARQPVVDGWAQDARMVEGIFQIMESLEPPWITLNVLEIAAVRFPDVDRETLRLTIMTVMMSQRRCVARLTRAGLRLGPRNDRDGNAYVELDLDFADRYSMSH